MIHKRYIFYEVMQEYLKTFNQWWFCLCVRAVNHPEYPSVLQALEIEDPVVANCLIDQRGIESVLLIKVTTRCFTRKVPAT